MTLDMTVLAVISGTGPVLGALVVYLMVLRRRHGGGVPMPAWLIRAESPSPALRELVARMARSATKDALAEWHTLPPGLETAIRMEMKRFMADRRNYTKDGERST